MIKSKIALLVALVATLSTPGLAQSPYDYRDYPGQPPAYAYPPPYADYVIPGSRAAQVKTTGN